VPTLVNFGGMLTDLNGKPLTGVVGITFYLYKDEQGGSPLWIETQNVQPNKTGHYSVMLGSTASQGLPADLFVSGEARWLGVQAQGQPEQPRVMLLSVPYALKAGDAATVGGLPPSAFVLAAPPPNGGTAESAPSSAAATPASDSAPPLVSSNVTTTGGTANTIPMFTTATNIQNSILTQTSTTAINVRGKLNLPATGTATSSKGFNSQPEDFVASVFNSSTSTAVPQTFQWQAEPLNNDLTTASGTLNLLYATGTATPAETGLKINNKGQLTFAAGQTFPGTGPGTVKSVGLTAPATDFTVSGSPVTSTGTLNFAWNVVPTSADTANAIVKRDPTGSFNAGSGSFAGNLAAGGLVSGAAGSFSGNVASGGTVSGAAGSFTGNLSVGGTITGNGSGLTSLHGVLLTELLGNVAIAAGTPPGYFNFITNYVPPVDATAFTFNRCGISATAAGEQLWFRSAIRTPTGTSGTVLIGNAFYLLASSAATESLFNENNDYFQLTAGQSYDFGVNFQITPPAGAGYCSEVVQIFAR